MTTALAITLLYTIGTGIGLLACGYYLGSRNLKAGIECALGMFLDELITAKLINQNKFNKHMAKKFGVKK